MRTRFGAATLVTLLAGCANVPPRAGSAAPDGPANANAKNVAPPATPHVITERGPTRDDDAGLAGDGRACAAEGGLTCRRFLSNEEAFRWILSKAPAVLAIGEAHAQRGTEAIASATKRFTESMLPLLEGRASDLLVEAWAGNPKCQSEVRKVAKDQKPVQEAQAQSNPNEYLTLGVRAKALGIVPDLLRPSCDDYALLGRAGADVVPASLALIKRLTQADATRLFERNQAAKNGQLVVTYGGAMHNDLAPSEALRRYSFGAELLAVTGGRYVELDLIVPEYVKDNDVWSKLPWYPSFTANRDKRDAPVLYGLGERSFVLIFAQTPP